MPLVVLGGEQQPNAELMELSTVPIGVAAEAHRYLAEGGPANLAQLHAFLSDTVLLTGEGFEPPVEIPAVGGGSSCRGGSASTVEPRPRRASRRDRLARSASSSTAPTRPAGTPPSRTPSPTRSTRPARRSAYRSSPPRCASAPDELYDALGTLDALVVTVLAAGGTKPATASAGGDDEAWDVERMAALDIPILQGLCLTSSREEWEASDDGVTPLDSANQIAIPEFDGRIITAPFSFKEIDEDGLPRYVADPERCARVAGIAVDHARLRHIPPRERKIALMLSAYPTKHCRVGNAVGLDTPVSTIRLLRRLRDAGLRPRRARTPSRASTWPTTPRPATR